MLSSLQLALPEICVLTSTSGSRSVSYDGDLLLLLLVALVTIAVNAVFEGSLRVLPAQMKLSTNLYLL